MWVALIEKLQASTLVDPIEYARESLDLIEHKKFIVRSTGRYAPPELRSEVNYQFKGGTWNFEKQSTDNIRRLQNSIMDSNIDLSEKSNQHSLISNNKLIINIAKSVFKHSSDKYPKSICRSLQNRYSTFIP